MEYIVNKNNVHIRDSYKISKKDFDKVLDFIRELYPECEIWKRSRRSIKNEWACHNLLYNMGYKRERTADVDIDYPLDKLYRIGYFIIGPIARILIG